ncbi:uncharacterized protein LOC133537113 isoform X1 [Nerophis ophidion]|uniref:uncharacterized protein LOC133537113 isoform X1 n=1 Tax=Nerophis ophidion TaxID=159077 RepID=UPI002AE046A6|nr:uncharacterized protein LOC133537113 isoform X1 [Nerophis ophidion]
MAEEKRSDSSAEKHLEVNASMEKSVRPKSSKVWEHFTLKTSKKTVSCKMCSMDLAWHGRTTLLREHLQRRHVGAVDDGKNSRTLGGIFVTSVELFCGLLDLPPGSLLAMETSCWVSATPESVWRDWGRCGWGDGAAELEPSVRTDKLHSVLAELAGIGHLSLLGRILAHPCGLDTGREFVGN